MVETSLPSNLIFISLESAFNGVHVPLTAKEEELLLALIQELDEGTVIATALPVAPLEAEDVSEEDLPLADPFLEQAEAPIAKAITKTRRIV